MIQKFIYFPTGTETGMKRHIPVIVYSFDLFTDGNRFYLKASTRLEEAERSSGKFLPVNRSVPFNEELWEACLEYVEKVGKLDKDYDKLYRSRKKYKGDDS